MSPVLRPREPPFRIGRRPTWHSPSCRSRTGWLQSSCRPAVASARLPLDAMDIVWFCVHAASAAIMGAAIGFERQWTQHPAGIKTHGLVAFGSAFFVALPHLLGDRSTNVTHVAGQSGHRHRFSCRRGHSSRRAHRQAHEHGGHGLVRRGDWVLVRGGSAGAGAGGHHRRAGLSPGAQADQRSPGPAPAPLADLGDDVSLAGDLR